MANINLDLLGISPEIFTEEDFLVEVETAINRIMSKKNIKQTELANKLEISKARVSQLLSENESKNMTLRTVAKIFAALGEKVEITSEAIRELNALVDKKAEQKAELRSQKLAQCMWKTNVANSGYKHSGYVIPNRNSFATHHEVLSSDRAVYQRAS